MLPTLIRTTRSVWIKTNRSRGDRLYNLVVTVLTLFHYSSAIKRSVEDAAAGDYSSAIETLLNAISLIKQSKVYSIIVMIMI